MEPVENASHNHEEQEVEPEEVVIELLGGRELDLGVLVDGEQRTCNRDHRSAPRSSSGCPWAGGSFPHFPRGNVGDGG